METVNVKTIICCSLLGKLFLSLTQLAAAAEIDEEPVSKAKQSRSEKKARKVSGASPVVVHWFCYPKLSFSSDLYFSRRCPNWVSDK